MASRRSTEERIEMVILYSRFQNYEDVRRQWPPRFGSDAPKAETIKSVFDRFCETGSVADLPRSGKPPSATTPENMTAAGDMVAGSPQTSLSAGASALQISRRSYGRILQELDLKPYHAQHVPELTEDDFDRRAQFCGLMLQRLADDHRLIDHIIWSDECKFMLGGTVNRHNNVWWGAENPHVQVPVPHSYQGVMVWCGMTSGGLVGPHFFQDNVNAASYQAMLETVLWPYAMRKGLTFQQDGAPAHYAAGVRAWLDQHFPGRWIGRRGPLEWPPRSPDLAPCDFFLWGYLKEQVYRPRPATIQQLGDRIQQCCAELPPAMCAKACRSVPTRLEECSALDGRQLPE